MKVCGQGLQKAEPGPQQRTMLRVLHLQLGAERVLQLTRLQRPWKRKQLFTLLPLRRGSSQSREGTLPGQFVSHHGQDSIACWGAGPGEPSKEVDDG